MTDFKIDPTTVVMAQKRAEYMRKCAVNDIRVVGYPNDSDHLQRKLEADLHYNIHEEEK